jgi:hypothetical protein
VADAVHYIPIATTLMSFAFAAVVFRRYRQKEGARHLLWWTAGILTFGAGTFTEGYTAVFGWHEGIFRAWYITGALLGGAPLAQGTVYLLIRRTWADRMTIAVVSFIAIATVFVLLTPVDSSLAEEHVLSGKVIDWTWVRAFSPFINTYAFIFLVGGATYSAMRYSESADSRDRTIGNIFIAVGALLPGIGGSFTRFGYTEVLYVTEFIGLILIYFGYRFNTRGRPAIMPATAHGPAAVTESSAAR